MKNTLFAIGEALIDFIPGKSGCEFSAVDSFFPKLGGAPANVLGAFSKLGGKTELITQLGDDPFGHRISKELSFHGIGTDYIKMTDKANTALAFVSLAQNGDRTFSFYRNPSADMLYSAENLSRNMFDDCFALHFCSVSLGNFPMRYAHKKAIEYAKDAGAIISFDPNLRFPLWKDKTELKKVIDEFSEFADIIKVSDEEIEFITGASDVKKGCRKLLEHAKAVICTCGSVGTYAYTKKYEVFEPSVKVKAIDTTGAGDAFCGSFLYSLYSGGTANELEDNLTEEKLKKYLAASNRYCAESVKKPGAIESYPNHL